jgi:hypothetical protein
VIGTATAAAAAATGTGWNWMIVGEAVIEDRIDTVEEVSVRLVSRNSILSSGALLTGVLHRGARRRTDHYRGRQARRSRQKCRGSDTFPGFGCTQARLQITFRSLVKIVDCLAFRIRRALVQAKRKCKSSVRARKIGSRVDDRTLHDVCTRRRGIVIAI